MERSLTPKFSFIIPTVANRENLLELISTLKNANLKDFEIIVVMQISTKNNTQIRTKLEKFTDIILIKLTGVDSVPMKRNLGFKRSRGDILCFIDDDVTIDVSLINFLKNSSILEGIIYFPEIMNSYYLPFPLGDHVGGKSYVSACFIINSKDFSKIGGMNDLLLTYRDDTEFFIRSVRKGMHLNFLDDAFVIHPVRRTNFNTMRSFFRKSELEPLFHKLTKGCHYGLLGGRQISFTPNRYGFSILTYFLVLVLIISVALFFLSPTLLIILLLTYSLFSLIPSSLYMIYPDMFLESENRRKFASVSIYMMLLVILIPARLIGSLKYKHFTL